MLWSDTAWLPGFSIAALMDSPCITSGRGLGVLACSRRLKPAKQSEVQKCGVNVLWANCGNIALLVGKRGEAVVLKRSL